MEITALSGPRFEAALELMRAGRAVTDEGVEFSVGADGALHCSVETSWHAANVTERTARADLDRARRVLEALAAASPEFAALAAGRPRRLSLIYSDGMGAIELARLESDEVRWARGFAPRA